LKCAPIGKSYQRAAEGVFLNSLLGGNGHDNQGANGPESIPGGVGGTTNSHDKIATAAATSVSSTASGNGKNNFALAAVDRAKRFFAPNWVELGDRGEPGTWRDFGEGALWAAVNTGIDYANTAEHLGNPILGLLPNPPQIPTHRIGDQQLAGAATFETVFVVGTATSGTAARLWSNRYVDFSRALTIQDLGLSGVVDMLRGTYMMKNRAATMRIDMIEGEFRNPLKAINHMSNVARSAGANTLRVEGTIVNERLMGTMKKRYGFTSEGANESTTIPLR
jgi:hypothetical protein